MNAVACTSLASSGNPSNSSAPRSGAVAPPLTDPAGPGRESLSISLATPTAAPDDSSEDTVAAGMCRLVAEVNGGATFEASEALSFVPAAESVLVYARRFEAGEVAPGLKLA